MAGDDRTFGGIRSALAFRLYPVPSNSAHRSKCGLFARGIVGTPAIRTLH